jgi:hypothetical protein
MLRTRIVFAAAVAGLLGACSPDPVNESHTGRLEESDSRHQADQSFYDEYKFKAKEGWTITIDMHSTEVDAFLQLRKDGRGDEYLQQHDDVAPDNRDAHIQVTADETTTYVVWANTASQGETGAYTLTITAQPAQ